MRERCYGTLARRRWDFRGCLHLAVRYYAVINGSICHILLQAAFVLFCFNTGNPQVCIVLLYRVCCFPEPHSTDRALHRRLLFDQQGKFRQPHTDSSIANVALSYKPSNVPLVSPFSPCCQHMRRRSLAPFFLSTQTRWGCSPRTKD